LIGDVEVVLVLVMGRVIGLDVILRWVVVLVAVGGRVGLLRISLVDRPMGGLKVVG
jgi:hypothetical protein